MNKNFPSNRQNIPAVNTPITLPPAPVNPQIKYFMPLPAKPEKLKLKDFKFIIIFLVVCASIYGAISLYNAHQISIDNAGIRFVPLDIAYTHIEYSPDGPNGPSGLHLFLTVQGQSKFRTKLGNVKDVSVSLSNTRLGFIDLHAGQADNNLFIPMKHGDAIIAKFNLGR